MGLAVFLGYEDDRRDIMGTGLGVLAGAMMGNVLLETSTRPRYCLAVSLYAVIICICVVISINKEGLHQRFFNFSRVAMD